MNEVYHFQVNLGGMLDVLSNHLYKTADVFLRELMQNGVDAITLRKKRQPTWKDSKISIQLKPEKQMIFKDNGAGLTKEEIHQFLSVIGQSSKQDLENGELLDDYIGRFGIGLLSCFMVSDSIIVHTKPMDGSQAYIWTGNPDGTYTLEAFEKAQIGTSISLTAKSGYESYFSIDKIINLVHYYGLTLPVPIYLEGKTEALNQMPADFSYSNRGQLLTFGEWLFKEEFLEAIPIETPHLSGAAYILPYQTDVSIKKGHRIYLKHMLLTEQGTPLLPNWAFFLRCFLNTRNLRPTASRENFYENEELELAKTEFSNAVKYYFQELSRNNPIILQKIVSVHFEAIKSMAVWDDEIFLLFIDYLPFSTSYGELTGAALKKVGEAVYIDDISRFKQLKPIFHAQDRLLICTGYNSDHPLISKLAQMFSLPITPLQEENMGLVLEDVTFQEQQEAFGLLRAINLGLKDFDCQAELRRFYPIDLPALYYISDDVQFLRQVQNAQETSSGIFSEALSSLLSDVAQKPLSTLYLNRNSPLIQRLLYLKNEKMLQSVAKVLYIHALVTGGHSLHREELKTLSQELLYLIDYNENLKKFKVIGGTDEK
ncbi:MAG: HSP90 family protein [Lachnospiraceae bacterium]